MLDLAKRVLAPLVQRPATPRHVRIGLLAGTRRGIDIDVRQMSRHLLVTGQSGVGIGTFCTNVASQYIAMGGGVVWIDGKSDVGTMLQLRQSCKVAGRGDDLLYADFDDPTNCNTYDPWFCGTPSERARRYSELLPNHDEDLVGDLYTAMARNAIHAILHAAEKTGISVSSADLALAFSNPSAMDWLRARLQLNEAALPSVVDGALRDMPTREVAQRLNRLLGDFAPLDARTPEVRFMDAMERGAVAGVLLPRFGLSGSNEVLARAAMDDLLDSAVKASAAPRQLPTLCVLHCVPWTALDRVARLMEQARSINLVVLVAFQHGGVIEYMQEAAPGILGNACTNVFFRPGTLASAAQAAAIAQGAFQADDLLELRAGECVVARQGSMPCRVIISRPREQVTAHADVRPRMDVSATPLRLAERMVGAPVTGTWTEAIADDSLARTRHRTPPLTVHAKPIEWECDGSEWRDKNGYGFYVGHRPAEDRDRPFVAVWGEGDPENFATLDQAQSWCQATIDARVRENAVGLPRADEPSELAAKRAIEARNEYLREHPGDAVPAMLAAIGAAIEVDASAVQGVLPLMTDEEHAEIVERYGTGDAEPMTLGQARDQIHAFATARTRTSDPATRYVEMNVLVMDDWWKAIDAHMGELARDVETLATAVPDAARWQWGVEHAAWIRHEHCAYVAIPVARDANLSCKAFRIDAVDAAMAPHKQQQAAAAPCWCRACRPVTMEDMRFVVCPKCGNKRCPKAENHVYACTGSNEPNQLPSIDGSAAGEDQ